MAAGLIVLRRKHRRSLFQHIHGLHTELRAHLCQLVKQTSACLIFAQTNLTLCDHVTGIDSHIHTHGGDTGNLISVDDRPLNWRCPPILRKQGRMNIQASVLWHVQDTLGQNLSKSRHNHNIRLIFLQILHIGIIPDPHRLKHLNSVL